MRYGPCVIESLRSTPPPPWSNNSGLSTPSVVVGTPSLQHPLPFSSVESFDPRHSMPHASAMRPIAASGRTLLGARQVANRSFTMAHKQPLASRANLTRSQQLRSSFRRSYADSAPAPKPKKSRFRGLKWVWRATYLSTIAGVAWVAYGIIDTKNPADQPPPDPSKKTLVVLGI